MSQWNRHILELEYKQAVKQKLRKLKRKINVEY